MSEIEKLARMRESQSTRWLQSHLDYPHNWCCLIWPFSRKGGGYVTIGGEGILVHRLVCEYRNGPAPTLDHHAAHSCERGHDGCVNQWHLDWKTPSQNQLDRFRSDPPAIPREKLTAEQAATIRSLKGIETPDLTAMRFGVCESNVRLIQAGKTWKSLSIERRIFTRDEVMLITTKPYLKSAKEFAVEFRVTKATIEHMRTGASYRYYSKIDDHNQATSPAMRGDDT